MGFVKPQPNHGLYVSILRRMSPEQRLAKAFELTRLARELFEQGLRRRHPDLDDRALKALLRSRLEKCRNRNF